MYQLTKVEWLEVITKCDNLSEGVKFSPTTPYAFTEQGVAMLSGVLKSKKALMVNIQIIRAFVYMRQFALSHKDLTAKLLELENKYDKQFKDVYDAINFLLQQDNHATTQKQRKRIGYMSWNIQVTSCKSADRHNIRNAVQWLSEKTEYPH